MELWIRSQDKTRLSIINNIQLVEWGGEYSLVGYTNDYVDDFDLGKYKTKERALEVLDEIQKRLKSNISYKENSLYLSNGYNYFAIPYEESVQVYEMPKE